MRIIFDVFGMKMSVQRKDNKWLLFSESDTGVKARVYDVVIPSDLTENELVGYLDDMYHEFATEKHPSATRKS